MVVSLTGGLQSVSQAQVQGMTAAVADVNKHGGVDGHQVTLKVVDDKLDPSTSVQLLTQEMGERKPDLVWHGITSDATLAMLPLLTRNKVLSIGNTQSALINDPKKWPYAFGLTTPNSMEGTGEAAALAKKGIKKVALLTSNIANGQSVAQGYTSALEAKGIKVTAATYAPTDLTMTAQLEQLKASDPDILLLQGQGPAVGYILRDRTSLGWDIPTLGTSSVGNGNNLGAISTAADWKNLDLLVYPVNTPSRPTGKSDRFSALLDSLTSQNAKFDQLMQIYTAPFDSLQLVKLAGDQAKSIDGDKMATALQNLKQPSTRPYLQFTQERFSSSNHFLDIDFADAFTVVKPGPISQGTIQAQ
jgi:branched-chain amino acid transport system substrate-binding protein